MGSLHLVHLISQVILLKNFNQNLKNMKNKTLLFLICISFVLSNCTSSYKNIFQLMPNDIVDFSTFFKVWITIFVLNMIAFTFLKHIGTVILFILVLVFKDYGFFLTVLIFSVDTIIFYLYRYLRLYFYSRK